MPEKTLPTVIDVADYLIEASYQRLNSLDDDLMTHMKLQKLAYYAQGFSLHFYGEPLFAEPIEAWEHGPVCPALYAEFRRFKHEPIKPMAALDEVGARFTPEQRDAMNTVLLFYGSYSAAMLRKMSHSDSAWIDAIGKQDKTISLEAMKSSCDKRLEIKVEMLESADEDDERLLRLSEAAGMFDSLDWLHG